MSDICNRSPSFVFLTKMSDRRQYDYVDNECYEEMDWFSARYSLIFLAETVILLAISNFWLKCPDCVNGLAHCEHLLSEYIMGEFSAVEGEPESTSLELSEEETREKLKKEREFKLKMRKFTSAFSGSITTINLSSLTWQYRLRGVVGLFATIVALLVNAICYSLRTGWTQCHLDGLASFSAKHRFFQCTRSMGAYFHVASILLFVLLSLHLIIVFWTLSWSFTGKRREPTYKIANLTFKGDAAFLFHFILHSNYGRYVRLVHEANQKKGAAATTEPLRVKCKTKHLPGS
ncbi:PREDICTED: volume-regulated anion channel subunit LRRC8A-like [Acropora digitifera]|uniref:volume-regulated anion channel subunit LRRC8A-like n=1 Tax=Acropora digitifera TaxID=70779 RepID=UPI00077AB1C1|nr:PREDICTED: volume-regulated anion channel subunit LRRC8A-like [Acropora digitifera]